MTPIATPMKVTTKAQNTDLYATDISSFAPNCTLTSSPAMGVGATVGCVPIRMLAPQERQNF